MLVAFKMCHGLLLIAAAWIICAALLLGSGLSSDIIASSIPHGGHLSRGYLLINGFFVFLAVGWIIPLVAGITGLFRR